MDARAVAANASQADYSTFLTKRQFIIHGAESIPARKGWKDMEEERREQILQMLRDHGCRITRQRKILLDIILEEECSCCKEIYYKASGQDTKIGFATVYRMVNMLEEIGAISRKNMYKVACEELCENGSCEAEKKKAANSCIVELSDRTTYCLSAEKLDAVFQAGLKACGYIEDQEIKKIAWNSDMCCAR